MLDTILEFAVEAVTEIGEAVLTKKLQKKKSTPDKTAEKNKDEPGFAQNETSAQEEPEKMPDPQEKN